MSLVFNQTASPYNGIIQRTEVLLWGDDGLGKISGNSQLLGIMTTEANLADNYAQSVILQADGRWQFDDSNHTDYPIIVTDLVANQRSYPFTTDENSNLILEIHKVLAAGADGVYYELKPVDQQNDSNMDAFWDGQNRTGDPLVYDKTGSSIFLDPIPPANVTNGLKIFITRENDRFTTADTTQKPGFAAIFHEFIPVRMAWQYAFRNTLGNMSALRDEMLRIEGEMKKYYAHRDRHEKPRMTMRKINYV